MKETSSRTIHRRQFIKLTGIATGSALLAACGVIPPQARPTPEPTETQTPLPTATLTETPPPTITPIPSPTETLTITATSPPSETPTPEKPYTPEQDAAWSRFWDEFKGDFVDYEHYPEVKASDLVRKNSGDPVPAYIAWLKDHGKLGAPWPKEAYPLKLEIIQNGSSNHVFDDSVVGVEDRGGKDHSPVRVTAPWRISIDSDHFLIGSIQEYHYLNQAGQDESYYAIGAQKGDYVLMKDANGNLLTYSRSYMKNTLSGLNRGGWYMIPYTRFPEKPKDDLIAIFPWFLEEMHMIGLDYDRAQMDRITDDWVAKGYLDDPDHIFCVTYGPN